MMRQGNIVDIKPIMDSVISKGMVVERSGKLYTSHDLYTKHQLYYFSVPYQDYAPFGEIEDVKPVNYLIEEL